MVGTGSWVQPTPASSMEGGENGMIPLRIRQGTSTVDLMVSGEDYYLLEKLRDNFAEEDIIEGGAAASNPERLCLRFVEAVILDGQSISASKAILRSFEEKFLSTQDIHSLAARSPASKDQEKDFIRSYYLACDACQAEPRKVTSALLEAASKGDVRIVDVFGGQGSCNLGCVQELVDLNHLYQPLIATLLKAVSPLLERLSTAEEVSDVFVTQPILIQQWINDATGTPTKEVIATAPYSIPINGLVGLAYYAMSCKVAGLTPGEMRMRLQGALGHSQGIAVAAAISAADSWEEFYEISRTTIETLFWIGYYSHKCSPKASLTAKLVADSVDNGEGRPSSLLSVRGLYQVQIEELIKKVNKSLSPNEHVFMALINSPSNFVLAGPANSLQGVNNYLRTMKIADNENQSRIPFNKRKPNVIHQFLPVSAPFHTSYLKEGAAKAKAAMSGRSLMSDRLAIAVYETHKGDDLRREPGQDLIHIIIDAIMQKSADFPATLKLPGITHVVSFGASRVGDLVAQVKDGYGLRSIFAGDSGSSDDFAGRKPEFFSPTAKIIKPTSWVEKFAPRLENTLTGELAVSTKLTRFLGVPHVLVAGMTPTTVWWDVVSAIMNAGYHAELAGGGYYNAESMIAAIKSLIDSVPAGKGVTCNVIYSSPRSIGWQIPMFQKLVREGIPVDGLAIGAGVPSAEVINEYITTLGLRHITLKPGSYSAIQDTIAVAAAHPTFPIILQWTGGRGGGHHSYEDFHVPILDMYSEIRKHDNIFLVAGSGFGGAEDTYAYLTGTWSTDLFGRAPMPFDGILMGSRLMVAKEAHTSPQAKELICAAPGVENIDDWTGSYEKPVGGVITVKSEMGQPIHKLATRGVLFWAEMDKIFALPKDKMAKEVENKKAYIVRRLNADFAKPYFGVNAGGRPVDLSEMTYAEVISRIIDLMYVRHQKRWVHKSYEKFARIFMARTLERLYDTGAEKIENLSDPEMVMQSLLSTYPLISTSILDPDDEAHFIQQCKARGQKPVNFVPIIDDGLETWMKKDSLWQSEDVDAVINQDVGRVCILHGPVAAKYSTRSDQTAKEILDEICSKHVEMMRNNQPNGVDRLTETKAENAENQPNLAILALCSEEYVLRGSAKVANPLRRVLQLPGASSSYGNSGNKLIIKKLGKSQDYVEIDAVDNKLLLVKLHYTKPGTTSHISLQLFYEWHPERRFYQIEEQARQRNNQIKEFYKALWVSEPRKPLGTLSSSFSSPRITLTTELLNKVQRAVSMGGSEHLSGSIANDLFPLDTMIMISWDALIKPLLVDELDGDLLALVHLSNKAEYHPGVAPFKLGDVITGTSSIETLKIGKSGKTMQVRAELSRNGEPAAVITTAFFFRGQYNDFHQTFRHIEEPEWALTIENKMDEAILKSREWIKFDSSCPSLIGKTLLFRVTTTASWDKPDQMSSMSAKGNVLLKISPEESQLIGKIFIEKTKCTGNVVMDYLERKGHLANDIVKLTQPGWDEEAIHELVIPSSNEAYSIVSSDCNPIHTAPIFAAWADLPGTITHGMYTSAMVRTVVESVVADGDRTRFRSFESKFTGMVMPGDVLKVIVQHIGMLDGCMVIDVKVYNKKTAVEVLEGTAIIEEVPTAFVFTGQGSQNKGMGMALYDSSPVAKKIWDDTDAFLLKTYGWSILEVVRNNPKTLKIHFGGKKGREIRANYLALTIQTTKPDGRVVMEPILKEINEHTTSHTFSEPRGLLFSTQFAQPAITLVSKAAFEDMKSKGLVAPGSTFAGHSLGEYGALSAFTEFIPFQTLMSVVFYRGLTMQVAMDRDEHGSTDFSMVAVNPSRVGKFMDEASTRRVLATIAGQSNGLMEIVNFNVKGEQYVAAGHLRNIHALGQVCDALATSPNATTQMKDFMSGTYEEGLTTDLGEFITEKVAEAQQLQKPFELSRGKATIPLKGIDVPFHSSYLRPSVPAYRRYLEDKLRVEDIVPERFIGKFIPNVMARPFSLSKEYFEEAARLTGSDVLKNIALTGAA